MKCMQINKTEFYYSLYKEKKPLVDEYGNQTGEYKLVYDIPKKYFGNISSAKGETATLQFGESEEYDKVIMLDKNAPEIDEYSRLWIDTFPRTQKDGSLFLDEENAVVTPHDYVVKKVAKSLNSVSIAIRKVKVSG